MNRIMSILLVLIISSLGAKPAPNDSGHVRIGLVLSAGGALGLAHIGVLKVLEREGIPVSCISTNSMGSIIGGLYAAGYSPAQIESIAVNTQWSTLFSPSISFGAQYLPEHQRSHRYILRWTHRQFSPSMPSELISLQKVELFLMKLLSRIEYNTYYNFDSLAIPFRVIAVDLVTGRKVVLRQGSLSQSIRGSIAIPGIFAPQALEEQTLVDGGVLQYLPVDPIFELEPDYVIAVLTAKCDEKTGVSLIDVISRTTSMVGFEDLIRQKQLADVVVEPDLTAFEAQDYSRAEDLIAAGEAAALVVLPEIKSKLTDFTPVAQYKEIVDRPMPVVNSVRFDGLHVTREATVRHEVKTKPGIALCFEVLHDDLVRLCNTALFNHVDYRLEFPDNNLVDVIIEVEEQAYGFYLLGIRYDNIDNAIMGIEIGFSNVRGSGVGIRAAVNLGDPNEYRLGFTDKRLFGFPFGYGVDIFWGSIDRSYYEERTWQADYNTDYRGGTAQIGYSIGRNAFFNVGFDAYQLLYRFPALSFFDTLSQKEWIMGPYLNVEFNTLDNTYLPSEGLSCKFNMAYSMERFKATNEFLKIDFSSDQYIPLSSWLLMHTGVDIGSSSGELSWSSHFYTGGTNFVGFYKEEFTTGHKAAFRFGLDFKIFELFKTSNYPVYLQLLSNVASFKRLDKLKNFSDLSSEDIHIGVGAGLRTDTPLGPIQLVVGICDFHRKNSDEDTHFALTFSVGRDFRYIR